MSETVSESPIKVFLLLENRLLREALDRLLRKRPDMLVVGRGGRGDCSTEILQEAECDVLVLDFLDTKWMPANLRGKMGITCTLKSLMIGMDGDFSPFLAAVRGGTTGYLLKDASTNEVVTGVRSTFKGEAVCPTKLCGLLFEYVSNLAKANCSAPLAGRPDLTLRQQQLVALIAKGLTNKEIATRLNLSEFTIRNHVHRILKQVDAGNRTEAVETILSHGYSLSSL
ncbi:MAG TPA: response regulator transcription factor [Candidatus Acidoferrum sp.]|nr:response regulator transcription factor [Candidatus Acidoferrum sp.]